MWFRTWRPEELGVACAGQTGQFLKRGKSELFYWSYICKTDLGCEVYEPPVFPEPELKPADGLEHAVASWNELKGSSSSQKGLYAFDSSPAESESELSQ
jgi:hypothetical protein